MKPIFLIGFMGSGKSTLGRALERTASVQFIDLDEYIERRYHANVRDIFAQHGEEVFRDRERRMLHEVGEFEDVVIACGGGTPCFFDNMAYMNSVGTTIFLDADIERLYARLLVGRHKRPTIANLDDEQLRRFISDSLERRMPFYSQCRHTFPSHRLDNRAEVAETVALFIAKFLDHK